MRGIILAAGEGKRLRPHTKDRPKALVKIKGRPLLEYQLQALQACGLRDIALVTGHQAHTLRELGYSTFHNIRYDQTNMVYSLFCAEAILDTDCVIVYGDVIFEPRLLTALLEDKSPLAMAVDDGWQALWSFRQLEFLKSAETLRIDTAGYIREIGKTPTSLEEIESQYIGLIKISAGALSELKAFYHTMNRQALYDGKNFENMYMTSFLQETSNRLMKIRPARVRHGWLEFVTAEDLRLYESLPQRSSLFDFSQFRSLS